MVCPTSLNFFSFFILFSSLVVQEYSENHHDVGIVFASLVNFNELYDESYMGGKEYLRVLNELISDFDEVLDRPEFKNVEKIKTIGMLCTLIHYVINN